MWGPDPESDCAQESVVQCSWTSIAQSVFEVDVERAFGEVVTLDFNDLFQDLTYPACMDGGRITANSFYSIELIIDNQGLTETSSLFRSNYRAPDMHLGNEVPPNRYVASTLFQQSLIYAIGYPN